MAQIEFDDERWPRVEPNRIENWARTAVVILIAGALVVGCSATAPICEGISQEAGGCEKNPPRFAGLTCEAIADEYGRQLDERIVALIEGPESREKSRAVRLWDLAGVATTLASRHLQSLGLECDSTSFLDRAETQFSEQMKTQVGGITFDEITVDYPTWRAELGRLLAIIDAA